MSDNLRIGIIGCGMISHKHAEAVSCTAGATLSGAYSHSFESCTKFAEEYNIQAFSSYEEMLLSKEIDAVAICSPSGNHAEQVLAAIQAGKHVMVEKPMALTLNEADSIVEAVGKSNVVVSSIAQLRYSDAAQAIKLAIDNGELGKIVTASLSMRYYRSQEYYDQIYLRRKRQHHYGRGQHKALGSEFSLLNFIRGQIRLHSRR